MATVTKTLVAEKFRYINVLYIETDKEHERLYQKIKKVVEEDKFNEALCCRIGCNSKGHLSKLIGGDVFSYRVIICDEHEKELMKKL